MYVQGGGAVWVTTAVGPGCWALGASGQTASQAAMAVERQGCPGSLEAVPLSPGRAVVAPVPQQFCWCRWWSLGPLVPWGWTGQVCSIPQLHARFFAQLEDSGFPIESFCECQTLHQPPLSATGGFTSRAPASSVVESKPLGSKPRTWSGKHRPGVSAHAVRERGRSQPSAKGPVLSLAGCCWPTIPY